MPIIHNIIYPGTLRSFTMSFSFIRRCFASLLTLMLLLYFGNITVAQSLMPPNPHLPAAVRAVMQQEEGQRTGQWRHQKHPVRDAGKQSVVNNPAVAPTQVLVSGAKQMPCILMKFPDLANTYSTLDFTNLLFAAGSGSANNYYAEVSFNQLSLAGEVDGWFTTNNIKSYYGDRTRRYANCAYEAAQKADAAHFNWAPYDNDRSR